MEIEKSLTDSFLTLFELLLHTIPPFRNRKWLGKDRQDQKAIERLW